MKLFGKRKKTLPIPEGCTADSIRVESGICTGERIIGFYSTGERKLLCAELVQSDADIAAFCKKYGIREPVRIPYTNSHSKY